MSTSPLFESLDEPTATPHIIPRDELAQVLGFNRGQFDTLMRAQITHPLALALGPHPRSGTPGREREELVFVRAEDEQSPTAPFWLQIQIAGVEEPVTGLKCEPFGPDHIKLSQPWLTSVLDQGHAGLSPFFFRATLGNEKLAAFEALVFKTMNQDIKPDYKPPVSPPYRPF